MILPGFTCVLNFAYVVLQFMEMSVKLLVNVLAKNYQHGILFILFYFNSKCMLLLMNTAFKQWICRFYLCLKLSSLMTSSVNDVLLSVKNKQKNVMLVYIMLISEYYPYLYVYLKKLSTWSQYPHVS